MESLTAAIVVRSLWAAERSSWDVGLLVGWVVVRRELVWPVSVDVVVAVGIWVRGISLKVGLGARPRRLVAARAGKSHWLATALEAYGGRSTTEATVEPSACKRGCGVRKSLDERGGRCRRALDRTNSAIAPADR